MNETLVKLGHRISDLRNKKGFTQEKLAELINYSPNHISKLESARTKPSFELLVDISKALNVELKDLFNFDEYNRVDNIKKEFQKIVAKNDVNKIKLLYKIYRSIYD